MHKKKPRGLPCFSDKPQPRTGLLGTYLIIIISLTRQICVDVVVQLYPWFNFHFPLFFFMLVYDDECETKENKN